jgi:hypothetical protein
MSGDVFKARLLGDKVEGREWFAREGVQDYDQAVVYLFPTDPHETATWARYAVPAHMVERVEDIPPEPTEPGTVMYDRDDVAWQRDNTVTLPWRMFSRSGRDDRNWRDLKRPTHPYPRAAREEIERLTRELKVAERGWLRGGDRAVDASREALKQKRRADELQRRIDRALDYLGELKPFSGRVVGGILRGEVDQ